MPDKLTPEQRHKNMSAIHCKDTCPELVVRRFLHSHGYRFRLHVKNIPAKPDIVLRRLHTVILINGCFWHGHGIIFPEEFQHSVLIQGNNLSLGIKNIQDSSCCKIPHTRREFWITKLYNNHIRDLRNRNELKMLGWNVITIWECELKPGIRIQTFQKLLYTLSKIELSIQSK